MRIIYRSSRESSFLPPGGIWWSLQIVHKSSTPFHRPSSDGAAAAASTPVGVKRERERAHFFFFFRTQSTAGTVDKSRPFSSPCQMGPRNKVAQLKRWEEGKKKKRRKEERRAISDGIFIWRRDWVISDGRRAMYATYTLYTQTRPDQSRGPKSGSQQLPHHVSSGGGCATSLSSSSSPPACLSFFFPQQITVILESEEGGIPI